MPTETGAWKLGTGGLRVLELEDSATDAELIHASLKSHGINCHVIRVADPSTFRQFVDHEPFDLILCDHCVPGASSIDALDYVHQTRPGTPIIMLSGSCDSEEMQDALRHGAADCVLKSELQKLAPAVRRALGHLHDDGHIAIDSQELVPAAALLHLTNEALVITSALDKITFWSRGAERLFGWTRQEALGRSFVSLLDADPALFAEAARQLSTTQTWEGELEILDKSGQSKLVFSRWMFYKTPSGANLILSATTDVTEKRKLEKVLLRAQRMDSIGSLASGIAHDLNNSLTPVLMTVELLRNCPDPKIRENFLDITSSAVQRATDLVSQILKFARGIAEDRHRVPLEYLLRDLVKMMRETFPKVIDIHFRRPETPLWSPRLDSTELHQALLNLCVNARDAMPRGGLLTLSVENITPSPSDASNPKIPAGPYIRLAVTDTGSGIAPHDLPHIFEPFFTTKPDGQGTGLGLSTVESIIRRCGGIIDLQSKVGEGTSLALLIPANLDSIPPKAPAISPTVPPRGNHELVLFMDDESAVRDLARVTLENHGFRVLIASNGAEGLAQFQAFQRLIRLVVSDADMPIVNGFSLLNSVSKANPDLPVILVSGSGHDTDFLRKTFQKIPPCLPKPYTPDQLLWAVHSALLR